jgi:nitrogen-specific signal transduction histidine kinase/ActR/RegA family two-component response regulator
LLDVSDQKQLESQLRQAQKMEAVGQLAAGIAHDFNNLLTVIHGYSSLQLAKSALDADVAKAFTQVKLASERASSLTRQLLAFSRKQLVQRKPLSLAATIARLQGMLSHALGETIQIECDFPAGLPCINADESNIEQVIMNLALNARDAMPTGGRLSLAAALARFSAEEAADHPDKRQGEFIALTVSDTGCGIDTQTITRIFEPFFTTKPVGRGTGLGLSTVYGIVKQHEGWVEVRSRPGQGTTFLVFLPTTQGEPELEPPALPVVHSRSSNLKVTDTILVVEDEPEVRELIALALGSEGYRVVQATTGAQALLDWAHVSGNVRLLLTDMVMPGGISGTMLAKRLRRQKPDLKVVYTSGYSTDVVGNAQHLTEGANFLPKPFTREQLLDTIKHALAAQSTGTELISAGAG